MKAKHLVDQLLSESLPNKKVHLNLVGLDGNAFFLMGSFQRQARREGWSPEEIKAVLDECKSGDYDHLLQTLVAVCDDSDDEDDEDDEDDGDDRHPGSGIY